MKKRAYVLMTVMILLGLTSCDHFKKDDNSKNKKITNDYRVKTVTSYKGKNKTEESIFNYEDEKISSIETTKGNETQVEKITYEGEDISIIIENISKRILRFKNNLLVSSQDFNYKNNTYEEDYRENIIFEYNSKDQLMIMRAGGTKCVFTYEGDKFKDCKQKISEEDNIIKTFVINGTYEGDKYTGYELVLYKNDCFEQTLIKLSLKYAGDKISSIYMHDPTEDALAFEKEGKLNHEFTYDNNGNLIESIYHVNEDIRSTTYTYEKGKGNIDKVFCDPSNKLFLGLPAILMRE